MQFHIQQFFVFFLSHLSNSLSTLLCVLIFRKLYEIIFTIPQIYAQLY